MKQSDIQQSIQYPAENRPNMKDYRGQRQRFQNKFNDIKFNNGNEPEIDMFSEAQAFMS